MILLYLLVYRVEARQFLLFIPLYQEGVFQFSIIIEQLKCFFIVISVAKNMNYKGLSTGVARLFMNKQTKRPVFLNLAKISLPVTGMVSILHRVTGILLALSIPLIIYLFDLSLRGPQGFNEVLKLFDSILLKVILTAGIWTLAHHMLAGIRVLLIDFDIGVVKSTARTSAWLVHGMSVLILFITMTVVWL